MSSGQPGCACRATDVLHQRHGVTRSCAQDGCLTPGMGNLWDMVVQDAGIPDVMVVRRAGCRDVRWRTRREDRRPGRRTHARFASDHVPQRAACARALHNHRRVIVILHDVVGTPARRGCQILGSGFPGDFGCGVPGCQTGADPPAGRRNPWNEI